MGKKDIVIEDPKNLKKKIAYVTYESGSIPFALERLQKEYDIHFASTIIKAQAESSYGDSVLIPPFTTPSIMATGRTKNGVPVVIYAHISNYFSNADNLRNAKVLKNGALDFPNEEFQRLVGRKDYKDVFVWDYKWLSKKCKNNIEISLEEAAKHPILTSFCGSNEIAKKYLKKCDEINEAISKELGEKYNELKFKITFYEDLVKKPCARLLRINNNPYGRYFEIGSGKGGPFKDDAGYFLITEKESEPIEAYTPKQISIALEKANLSGIEGILFRNLGIKK